MPAAARVTGRLQPPVSQLGLRAPGTGPSSLEAALGLRWGLRWALTGLVAGRPRSTCAGPSHVQGASLGEGLCECC